MTDFETKYPDVFTNEKEEFLNNVHARILRVGERYHTSVILVQGQMQVITEDEHAKRRIYAEAENIMIEEMADFLAKLLLYETIQEA